jgi:hypothetical protein
MNHVTTGTADAARTLLKLLTVGAILAIGANLYVETAVAMVLR